jgi:hypothetical protein
MSSFFRFSVAFAVLAGSGLTAGCNPSTLLESDDVRAGRAAVDSIRYAIDPDKAWDLWCARDKAARPKDEFVTQFSEFRRKQPDLVAKLITEVNSKEFKVEDVQFSYEGRRADVVVSARRGDVVEALTAVLEREGSSWCAAREVELSDAKSGIEKDSDELFSLIVDKRLDQADKLIVDLRTRVARVDANIPEYAAEKKTVTDYSRRLETLGSLLEGSKKTHIAGRWFYGDKGVYLFGEKRLRGDTETPAGEFPTLNIRCGTNGKVEAFIWAPERLGGWSWGNRAYVTLTIATMKPAEFVLPLGNSPNTVFFDDAEFWPKILEADSKFTAQFEFKRSTHSSLKIQFDLTGGAEVGAKLAALCGGA